MSFTAGVDGCPAGWICIARDSAPGVLASHIFPNAQSLFDWQPRPQVIAIDIPIGLTQSGPRECDLVARQRLGQPRQSSVFPSPIRPVLSAKNRAAADRLRRALEGRGVSAQAFGIYQKVRDVDDFLSARPGMQQFVREIHPELCFWAWNGQCAMLHCKRSAPGAIQRRALIDKHFGPAAFDSVRALFAKGAVADDDILDAFAALWTAERIVAGEAQVIPTYPPVDAHGLRMEMWY